MEVVLPVTACLPLSIRSDYDFLRFGTVQPEVVSFCPVIDVRELCDTRFAVLCPQNHIRVVGKFDKNIAVVLGSQISAAVTTYATGPSPDP